MLPYDLDDPGLAQTLKSLDLVVEPASVEEVEEDLEILTEAVANCRKLETIKLAKTQDEDSPLDNFFLPGSDVRFPAVRNLSLEDYAWPPKSAISHNFWNFSKIENLSLIRVPLLNFLRNSTFISDGVMGLKELTIEALEEDIILITGLPQRKAWDVARGLLWTQAKKLQTLTIHKFWDHICPLRELKNLEQHLTRLDLLDCGSDYGDSWSPPQNEVVTPDALKELRVSLPRLLELNFGYVLSGKTPAPVFSPLVQWLKEN
jgi:hypothetical protein